MLPALGPGAWSPGAPAGMFSDGGARISRVPGEPCCAFALLYDPGRALVARLYRHLSAVPAYAKGDDPDDRMIFRGSITRRSHSLSTLRSRDCSRTTQDSLSADG